MANSQSGGGQSNPLLALFWYVLWFLVACFVFAAAIDYIVPKLVPSTQSKIDGVAADAIERLKATIRETYK